MWNTAAWNPWVDRNQEIVVNEPESDLAIKPETTHATVPGKAIFSDTNSAAKRQRRPSVRLNEIGDQPAATFSDLSSKKKASCKPLSSSHTLQEGQSGFSEGNGALEDSPVPAKPSKSTKIRPLVHVNDGSFPESNSRDDAGDSQGCFMPADLPSSHYIKNDSQTDVQLLASQSLNGRRRLVEVMKKRGRNANRRSGMPRVRGSVEKVTVAVCSHHKERVTGTDAALEPQSDEAHDTEMPEGYRECDFELSDTQEISHSMEEEPTVAAVSMKHHSHGQWGNQHGLANGEHAAKQDQEQLQGTEDKRASTNSPVRMIGSRRDGVELSSEAEVKSLGANSMQEDKNKLMLEAKQSKEPTSRNPELQLGQMQLPVRQYSPLSCGVKAWLQNLGLGRYAQLFEAHEVDTEVLPLLTLDDLKEMGISAVGTRRKMFYAIQQLGKGLLGRSD